MPKRKPAAAKKAAGTYRADREAKFADAQYQVLTYIPEPPDDLGGKHAVAMWRSLAVLLVDSGTLTSGDLAALQLLCEVHQYRRDAEAILKAGGPIVSGSKGQPSAHPMLAVRRAAAADEAMLLRAFGLVPAARIGVPAKKEPRKNSPFTKRPEPKGA